MHAQMQGASHTPVRVLHTAPAGSAAHGPGKQASMMQQQDRRAQVSLTLSWSNSLFMDWCTRHAGRLWNAYLHAHVRAARAGSACNNSLLMQQPTCEGFSKRSPCGASMHGTPHRPPHARARTHRSSRRGSCAGAVSSARSRPAAVTVATLPVEVV